MKWQKSKDFSFARWLSHKDIKDIFLKIIIQYNSPVKAGPDESDMHLQKSVQLLGFTSKSGLFFLRKTTQNAVCKAEQEGTAIPQVYDCAFRLIYKNSCSKSWRGFESLTLWQDFALLFEASPKAQKAFENACFRVKCRILGNKKS